jgi:MFS transporter, DHA2 family, multidrug resistance protein
VIILLLPLAGWLLKRVQPKYLIAFGFFSTSVALWLMSYIFTTSATFNWLTLARCMQAFGLAFVFVPINTVAYTGLPKGKSNQASALINLMRNLGGSVGISVAQTMIDRRSQFHQNRLIGSISQLNHNVWNALHGWSARQTTVGPPDVSQMPRSIADLYKQLGDQATMMSYLDVFHVVAIAALVSVAIVLFMRRIKLGEEAEGH